MELYHICNLLTMPFCKKIRPDFSGRRKVLINRFWNGFKPVGFHELRKVAVAADQHDLAEPAAVQL